MNDKFFQLPAQKQKRILNAAYKVFAQSPYKKASMSLIAYESGVSKSLLFYYFKNKQDLYLYLWIQAIEMTRKTIQAYKTLETDDFFEMLRRSLRSKCALMKEHPYLYAFSLQAYYETEPSIQNLIQDQFHMLSQSSEAIVFERIDRTRFRKKIDLRKMYQEILYAMDGYMLSQFRSDPIVPNKIEKEIMDLIEFWETIYYQKENENGA
ncbi:TetR/AcrR family transcriptional regulator [Dubosiella newyorkensis]|uniref:TetR/AcrR family transcriptional regulator n=1 Tax=Dubosiella newyorkensis TaxID=1862672 RepID=UPI002729CF07|nr:TetR/AcrR family transcriptional regulator [Dubosiella newyorkensis]